MAKIYITQFARQGRDDRGAHMAPELPALGTIVLDTAVAGGVTARNIDKATRLVSVYADVPVMLRFGAAPVQPTLALPGIVVQAATATTFSIDMDLAKAGLKVAGQSLADIGIGVQQTVTIHPGLSMSEGDEGVTMFPFVVERSDGVGTVEVPWTFIKGTTSPDDFAGGSYPAGGIIRFAVGETRKTILIAVNADKVVEPDEQFGVTIGVPEGYTAGLATIASAVIRNDDVAAPVGPIAPPPPPPAFTPNANVLFTFDGDSKAPEMADSARKAVQRKGLDVDWSGRTSNAGGFGVGGSTPTDLVAPARKAATLAKLKGYVDAGRILYHGLHCFTNGTETVARNLEILAEYHADVVRAAGVKWFFVSSVNPNNLGGLATDPTTVSGRIRALNVALRQYCEANAADTVFVDEEPFLIDQDPANTQGLAIPYLVRTEGGRPANSTMRDGVHKSANGNHRASFAYDAPLTARVVQIAPLIVANANAYGPANLAGNLGGEWQRVTSSALTGLRFTPSVSGSLALAFENEDIVVPPLVGYVPAGTYPGARLVISGATGEIGGGNLGATLDIGQFFVPIDPALPAGTIVRTGLLCRFNNMKGVCGVSLGAGGWYGQAFGSQNVNTSNSPLAEVVYDGFDGWYFFDTDSFDGGGRSQAQALQAFLLGPNVACSGSVSFLIVNYLRKVN